MSKATYEVSEELLIELLKYEREHNGKIDQIHAVGEGLDLSGLFVDLVHPVLDILGAPNEPDSGDRDDLTDRWYDLKSDENIPLWIAYAKREIARLKALA